MNDLTLRLKTFQKVAELRSFSAAARELGIASSTATRYIGQLERQLGEPLLIRSTRQVRLTAAGERALTRIGTILEQFDLMDQDLKATGQTTSGTLRVSGPWRYTRLYIAPLVRKFMVTYPDITLHIISSDHWVNLTDAEFDVAVRIGHLEDSSLIARKIADQQFVLAAAPAYLNRHAAITRPKDLATHTLLTFDYTTASHHWQLKHKGHTCRIPIRDGTLRSNNADVLTRAALDGAGIVLQPCWAIREELESGQLTPVLGHHEVTSTRFESGVHVVFTQEKRNNPCVRAWVDFLMAHADRLVFNR